MQKVMLSAAVLAMVLAAAVPAVAQSVMQNGDGDVACVQAAVQNEVNKTQINEFGDNINIQQVAQECNVTVAQVDTVITNLTASSTSATASASVASASASASALASASASASASAAPTVQYQYGAAAGLPSTGGSSLIALGVGILLVAGGLLARKIVR